MRYAVVIERAENNYAAYVPDLPGCVATGKTMQEIKTESLGSYSIPFTWYARGWFINSKSF